MKDKIITPELIAKAKRAEDDRFFKITEQINDESTDFLERLKEWIEEALDEIYSISD